MSAHKKPGNRRNKKAATKTAPPAWTPSLECLEDRLTPTNAPFLVVDLAPAQNASTAPRELTNVNGTLFFTGNHLGNPSDVELFRSDGTSAGTGLVKDINPAGSSAATGLINVNGTLFFRADDGIHGVELWKSDGTSVGTTLVKDIQPGAGSSDPRHMVQLGELLFFLARHDAAEPFALWKSDGTEGGTELVHTEVTTPPAVAGGWVYFQASDDDHGGELWKTDGVNTQMVADIHPDPGIGSGPMDLAGVGDFVYFSAFGKGIGRELYKSDGTSDGTVLVKDIRTQGDSNSHPGQLTNVNGVLFFTANDGINGIEPWVSDGTSAGTFLLCETRPGIDSGGPGNLTAVGDQMFFTANNGNIGVELWKSDGTTAGTGPVRDIRPGAESSVPSVLTNVNGVLFFVADDGENGHELWKSDGTLAGTMPVSDFAPARPDEPFATGPSGQPDSIAVVGEQVFFDAASSAGNNDSLTNNASELWAYDTIADPIDGLVDTIGVFNAGTWFLRNANSPGGPDIAPFNYGAPNWIPVTGDWNGDGIDTIGVVDPATMTWYLRNDNSPGGPDVHAPFQYGAPGWVPVVGDWDGDGVDSIGVFNPGNGTWFLRNSNSPGGPDVHAPFNYGGPGWRPVVGDWDGDGTDTIGVVDPSNNWYLRNANSPGGPNVHAPFNFGAPGWRPIVGDWDGNGTTTIGVVDPGNNWFLRNANSPGGPDVHAPFNYGGGGWVPLAGDWNGPDGENLLAAQSAPIGQNATLSTTDLSATVSAAFARLELAGIDGGLLEDLRLATFQIVDLPGRLLGLANSDTWTISLDSTAAGIGWFVDSTPDEDEEFTAGSATDSPADSGYDLLSVVLHELGHLAGHPDLEALAHPEHLMADTLDIGVRRVSLLDAVFGG